MDEGAEGGGPVTLAASSRGTSKSRVPRDPPGLRIPRRPSRPKLLGMTGPCALPARGARIPGPGGPRLRRRRGAPSGRRGRRRRGEGQGRRVDERDLRLAVLRSALHSARGLGAEGGGLAGLHEAPHDRAHPALRDLAGQARDDEVVAGAGERHVEESPVLGGGLELLGLHGLVPPRQARSRRPSPSRVPPRGAGWTSPREAGRRGGRRGRRSGTRGPWPCAR